MSWPLVKLETVANVNWGNTSITKSSYRETGYAAYSATGNDGFLGDYENDCEGIVLSAIGARCGKCFLVNGKWTAIKNTITIIPSSLACTDYLFFYLNREKIWPNKGGAQPFISLKVAKALPIPLPPLPVQKQIAAVLEKADTLRQQCQQMEQELNALAQSVFLDMFGDPVANPKKWKTYSLEQVCSKITDGTHHSPVPTSEGIPYITAKHLKKKGLDFYLNPTFISKEAHKRIYARCNPVKGDVLYIKDGATTGIAAINNYDFEFSMLSSLALLKPSADLSNSYLLHWLNNELIKRVILREVAGAAITRLTIKKIKAIKINLPPLSEQRKYDEFLGSLNPVIENIKLYKEKADEHFNSLMQRAFKGELDLKDVA